jgi:hypothetical protein
MWGEVVAAAAAVAAVVAAAGAAAAGGAAAAAAAAARRCCYCCCCSCCSSRCCWWWCFRFLPPPRLQTGGVAWLGPAAWCCVCLFDGEGGKGGQSVVPVSSCHDSNTRTAHAQRAHALRAVAASLSVCTETETQRCPPRVPSPALFSPPLTYLSSFSLIFPSGPEAHKQSFCSQSLGLLWWGWWGGQGGCVRMGARAGRGRGGRERGKGRV